MVGRIPGATLCMFEGGLRSRPERLWGHRAPTVRKPTTGSSFS
jgi:hypothetical protein